MGNCCQEFTSVFEKSFKCFDCFGVKNFPPYQQETTYRSKTGACCTIIIILTLGILFIRPLVTTIQKQGIQLKEDIVNSEQPLLFQITNAKIKPFFFVIALLDSQGYFINLNNPKERFFQITVINRQKKEGKINHLQQIKMTQCSQQNFTMLNKSSLAPEMTFQKFLCPLANQSFILDGHLTLANYKFLQLQISKCYDSADLVPCSSEKTLNLMELNGHFRLNFYFINPYLRLREQKQMVKYELQDKNSFFFSRSLAVEGTILYSPVSIESDSSISPAVLKGSSQKYVNNIFQSKSSESLFSKDDIYARIYLEKDYEMLQYTRSYPRLDIVFSTVSQILGFTITIIGICCMRSYNTLSHQVDFAIQEQSQSIPQEYAFHLPNFILYKLYSFFSFFSETFSSKCSHPKFNFFEKCIIITESYKCSKKQLAKINELQNKVMQMRKQIQDMKKEIALNKTYKNLNSSNEKQGRNSKNQQDEQLYPLLTKQKQQKNNDYEYLSVPQIDVQPGLQIDFLSGRKIDFNEGENHSIIESDDQYGKKKNELELISHKISKLIDEFDYKYQDFSRFLSKQTIENIKLSQNCVQPQNLCFEEGQKYS